MCLCMGLGQQGVGWTSTAPGRLPRCGACTVMVTMRDNVHDEGEVAGGTIDQASSWQAPWQATQVCDDGWVDEDVHESVRLCCWPKGGSCGCGACPRMRMKMRMGQRGWQ